MREREREKRFERNRGNYDDIRENKQIDIKPRDYIPMLKLFFILLSLKIDTYANFFS